VTISNILEEMKSQVQPSGTAPSQLDGDSVTETEPEVVPPIDKGKQKNDQVPSVVESERVKELEDELKQKDERIAQLEKQIQEKDEHLMNVYVKNEELTLENERLKSEVVNVNAVVDMLRAEALEATVQETTQKATATKKRKINQLQLNLRRRKSAKPEKIQSGLIVERKKLQKNKGNTLKKLTPRRMRPTSLTLISCQN
jgi:predicted RNase H-like nuclease (RuvC/YqgF family)